MEEVYLFIIYLILVLTFGFTLSVSDIAIGRKTGKNAVNTYSSINKKWSWLGMLTFCTPIIITMYYGVIGGWILKYFIDFCYVDLNLISQSDYFTNFITSSIEPPLLFCIDHINLPLCYDFRCTK